MATDIITKLVAVMKPIGPEFETYEDYFKYAKENAETITKILNSKELYLVQELERLTVSIIASKNSIPIADVFYKNIEIEHSIPIIPTEKIKAVQEKIFLLMTGRWNLDENGLGGTFL